jgi:hypothetical protein
MVLVLSKKCTVRANAHLIVNADDLQLPVVHRAKHFMGLLRAGCTSQRSAFIQGERLNIRECFCLGSWRLLQMRVGFLGVRNERLLLLLSHFSEGLLCQS